jgi:hypothetical protein
MASLLLPGKAQFLDSDGKPLAGGSVTFYIPGTSTLKATFQDAAATIQNTNPIILDAAGEAVIYGSGGYRQVLQDSAGNQIWDQLTSEANTLTGDFTVSGTVTAAAVTSAGQGAFASVTAGALTSNGDLGVNGSISCGYLSSSGNVDVGAELHAGYVLSHGNIDVQGTISTVSGTFNGSATGWHMEAGGTGAFSGGFNVGVNSGAGVVGTIFIASSDSRVKTEIEDVPFADAYRFVREMRAKVFLKDGTPDAGFIAQDAIHAGFQRMVIVSETADPRMAVGDDVSPIGKRLNLNYNHATAYHHRMIDFLLDRVDDLQKQIELLKN